MTEPCRVTADLERHLMTLEDRFADAEMIEEFKVDAVLDLVRNRKDQKELMIEAIIECLYDDESTLFQRLMDEVELETHTGTVILKEFLACCDETLISERALQLGGESSDE